MATIDTPTAIGYARAAGFSGDALVDIVAIAWAESSLNTDPPPNSLGPNGPRGILQIYLAVHPDVTLAQALNPAFSFRYAYKLSGGGASFCAWQSWSGAGCGKGYDNRYAKYLPVVRAALGLPSTDILSQTVSNTVDAVQNTASAAKTTF